MLLYNSILQSMHSINEDIQKLLMLDSKRRPPIDAAVQEFPTLVFHPAFFFPLCCLLFMQRPRRGY